MALGFGVVILGAELLIRGSSALARQLKVSDLAIGLTIVAVGTSLPELTTSAVAAWRGNSEIAIGNVVGSNIFNIFFILGISAVIRPLPFAVEQSIDAGVVVAAASLLLLLFMLTGKRRVLDGWEGAVCLLQGTLSMWSSSSCAPGRAVCFRLSMCAARISHKLWKFGEEQVCRHNVFLVD